MGWSKVRRLGIGICLLGGLVLGAAGCVNVAAAGSSPPASEIVYETIKIPSSEFDQLMSGDVGRWYDKSYRLNGLHSYVQDSFRYFLVSAGEKPTTGYTIENLRILGNDKEIEVKASLHTPHPGEIVAQVISYPHVLVRIPKDNRNLVFNGIEGNKANAEPTGSALDKDKSGGNPGTAIKPEAGSGTPGAAGSAVRTDSGRFVGQIDANSVEIRVSGVPNAIAPSAFQLSEKLKVELPKYGLKKDEEVMYQYVLRENQRPVLLEIKRLH